MSGYLEKQSSLVRSIRCLLHMEGFHFPHQSATCCNAGKTDLVMPSSSETEIAYLHLRAISETIRDKLHTETNLYVLFCYHGV